MQTSRAANQNSTVDQTAFTETLKYAKQNYRLHPVSLEKPSTGKERNNVSADSNDSTCAEDVKIRSRL